MKAKIAKKAARKVPAKKAQARAKKAQAPAKRTARKLGTEKISFGAAIAARNAALLAVDLGKIVDEAKSWIGTPYKTGGSIKGPSGGVDCSNLVHEVYESAGYVYPYVPTGSFPPPGGFFVKVTKDEEVKEGDVALFAGHMGIVALADRVDPSKGDLISAQGSPTKPGKVQFGKAEWFAPLKGIFHWAR